MTGVQTCALPIYLPNSGIVRVDGIDVAGLDDARRSALRGDSIGFVFQQFHLIPHLSAAGNVETALLYRNLKASERRRRAETALVRVGLVARADHRRVRASRQDAAARRAVRRAAGAVRRRGRGIGIVHAVWAVEDWTVVIDYGHIPTWIGLAVGVSVIAGLLPSVKAARLEPLETLRLG